MSEFRKLGDELREHNPLGGLQVTDELPNNKLPYGCPKCDGYGNIIDGDGARPCECKLEYYRQAAIKKLPSKYQQMTLDNFSTETPRQKQLHDFALAYLKSVKKSRQVLRGVRPGLFIYGDSGRGKTHLLIGIYRELLKINILPFPALFFYADLIRGMQENINDPFSFDLNWDHSMYFLDGLGERRKTPTEFEVGAIRDLIAHRHRHNLPICITTNYSPAQLGRLYGDFVASRVMEGMVKGTEGIEDQRPDLGVHVR